MTTNWREKLDALFLRWQYFKPAPECVAEFEALIREARRAAFEEAAEVAMRHGSVCRRPQYGCGRSIAHAVRVLAAKEGGT